MVKLRFDFRGIKQFAQLSKTVEEAVRPAAQAGAQVFYDEMRSRVERIGRVTGNLLGSLYQKYVPESAPGKATYHMSWRKPRRTQLGVKNEDAGLPTAPHGYLVEYGHIQRYQALIAKRGKRKGQWITLVRPEMRGKPRPKRRASQAERDAYYVLRKGGPLQVPAQSFLRSSFDAKQQVALSAAAQTMKQRLRAAP